MRVLKLLVLLFFLIPVAALNSGAQETVKKKGDVYLTPEVMPEYPGGNEGLTSFIMKNVNYPEQAKKEGITGKVFVSFIIDKQGKVTKVKVEESVHTLLDNEAVRVVKLMDKWTPGKEKGKPVKVQYTLPINFALS
ncbi:MAG: energy transducer TonB [Bacteroidota bacterium]